MSPWILFKKIFTQNYVILYFQVFMLTISIFLLIFLSILTLLHEYRFSFYDSKLLYSMLLLFKLSHISVAFNKKIPMCTNFVSTFLFIFSYSLFTVAGSLHPGSLNTCTALNVDPRTYPRHEAVITAYGGHCGGWGGRTAAIHVMILLYGLVRCSSAIENITAENERPMTLFKCFGINNSWMKLIMKFIWVLKMNN